MSPTPEGYQKLARHATWAALGGLALLGLTFGIGSVPLLDPDEGRNAEVAREMAATNNYLVPHLNGLPYLDKPIVLFATAAAAIEVLGPTETAARLPSLLFTLATVVLTMWFGRHVLGPRDGTLAGLALATCPLVVAFARIAIFDSTMMFWVSASLMAFYLAWEGSHSRWIMIAWAAMGVATLTKGPVGLVLPLLTTATYALLARRPVRTIFAPLGIAAFIALVGPWFLAMTLQHPEFPHYVLVRETFERVATDRMHRSGPWFYFIPLLALGALPWITLPLASVSKLREAWGARSGAGRSLVFLLLWIVIPFVFFSLSQSKRPGYILPVFPAVALLGAHLFNTDPRGRRWGAWTFAALGVILGAVLLGGAGGLASSVDAAPAVQAKIPVAARGIGAALGLAGLLTAGGILTRSPSTIVAGFALSAPLVPIAGHSLLRAIAADRSAKALAEAITATASLGARVIGVEAYPPSLPYYLGDQTLLSTASARELTSNYIAEYVDNFRDPTTSTLRPVDWWRDELARCPAERFFVVRAGDRALRDTLRAYLELTAATRRYSVYGPCQPKAKL